MKNVRSSLGCALLILMVLGGCSPSSSGFEVCDLIATTPNFYVRNVAVPGVAYMSVNPNTPTGNGGAWGGKGEDQVVLAFHLFRKQNRGCKAPKVTGLVMEAPSSFVTGRSFTLYEVRHGHLVKTSVGQVTVEGKLNVSFLSPKRLDNGTHYYELHLDTSSVQSRGWLAITSGIVDYEVNGKPYRSYQQPYTPPPLEF